MLPVFQQHSKLGLKNEPPLNDTIFVYHVGIPLVSDRALLITTLRTSLCSWVLPRTDAHHSCPLTRVVKLVERAGRHWFLGPLRLLLAQSSPSPYQETNPVTPLVLTDHAAHCVRRGGPTATLLEHCWSSGHGVHGSGCKPQEGSQWFSAQLERVDNGWGMSE